MSFLNSIVDKVYVINLDKDIKKLESIRKVLEEQHIVFERFNAIDGNTVALDYSGVSFDITAIAMVNLGGGNYSGTVETNTLLTYSAGTLDFTGRTIWADVSGITRTDRLIVGNNPTVGYVLTCIDSEGMVAFLPSSGALKVGKRPV